MANEQAEQDEQDPHALRFGRLRELWLMMREALHPDSQAIKALVDNEIASCSPTRVPNPDVGDSADVYFSDGSTLRWDWDEGLLSWEEISFTYPWDDDDILFTFPRY